jgi:hypothetical protein
MSAFQARVFFISFQIFSFLKFLGALKMAALKDPESINQEGSQEFF